MNDAQQDSTTSGGAEARGWRPEQGDVIEGAVVDVSRGWSDWTDSYYPLLTIHDDAQDRDIDLHAFHQSLHERLMELRPKVGDKLKVEYLGKQAVKSDSTGRRTVAVYRVTAPDATGAEVWESLGSAPVRASQAAKQGELPKHDDTDIPF